MPVNNAGRGFAGGTGCSLSRRDVLHIGMIALLIGAVFFIFHRFGVSDVGYFFKSSTTSLFYWLYRRWLVDYHESAFAFSHWIPLISLILVWMDRRRLASLPRRINWAGLVLVLFSFAIHWAGVKTEQTRLSIISLIALSWSFPLFICGWPTAKRLIFPCGFLLFSIPLNFFDALAHPLRIMAASITATLLSGLGIDVTRSGPMITSPAVRGFRVDMADSFSSIFALTATVAFSLLCAYLIRSSVRRRIIVVVSSMPLYILGNVLRGIIVMLAASAGGESIGTTVRTHFTGPIVLLTTFGGLAALAWIFHQRIVPHIDDASQPPADSNRSITRAVVTSLAVTMIAAVWIPTHVTVVHREEAGVHLDLPAVIGAWQGETILYCHNPQELREFVSTELRPGDPCPSCGQPLLEWSPTEKALLPPDTLVRKKKYETRHGQRVYLSIVLSGKYRSSIHRPEVCLVGQNSRIAHSFIHDVSLADGRILKVKILEMVHLFQNAEGESVMGTMYYAYWFAGIGRETPSHLQRMAWMASDRLFKNESYRWAYLALAGGRIPNNQDYLHEIDSFLKLAYPYLVRKDVIAGW